MNTYSFILITGEPGRPQIIREVYPSEERAKERARELYNYMDLKRVILRGLEDFEFSYGDNTQEKELITLQELSKHLELSPLTLRRKLRGYGFAKPGTRWAWPKGSPIIPIIIDTIQQDQKEL